jgi:ElaB/YqjD/DUF883 family membrane-anchored ribosome-binding protein
LRRRMNMTGPTGTPTSTEKILASGTEEVGAPTPAAKSPVNPQTGISGIAESAKATARSGDVLRSNVADTPGTDTSGNDTGIKPGSLADQYQRRSGQVSETAEHLRMTASRTADQFRQQGQRGVSVAQSIVRENPVASMIVAIGAGLLLGSLLRQGGRGGSRRHQGWHRDY